MRDPQSYLPLKPVDLEILFALAEEDRHGYAMVQAISRHTGGLIVLDPGNLYRVLKRLLVDGLVAEADPPGNAEDGAERRRYYRLTPIGGRVLAAELTRLQSLLKDASTRTIVRRWTS